MSRFIAIVAILLVLVLALFFWKGLGEQERPGQPSPHALDQSQ
ncbi:hypothetical protein [Rhizobium sp. OAE497]|jgi:hypothetical protein